MKQNEWLNEALANVDDKYIMAAMQPPRRASGVWKSIGAVAACLLILIGGYFPLRYAMGHSEPQAPPADAPEEPGPDVPAEDYPDPDDPGTDDPGADDPGTDEPGTDEPGTDDPGIDDPGADDPEPPRDPSAPPLPWADTLFLEATAEKTSYAPGEPVRLYLQIGVANDYLGEGDLRVSIKAPDFDVEVKDYAYKEGSVIIENVEERIYSLWITLTPNYEEAYAMGTITLSVAFVPDDANAFMDKIEASDVPENYYDWQTIFWENGALWLGSTSVDYAADQVELILDSTPMGAVDTWEIMIARHYEEGKITTREFADMYYHWSYRNHIYASIDVYREQEQTVRFSYMSQNIRYAQLEMIDDPQMWALYENVRAIDDRNSTEAKAACRALAEYILLYMREQGIITVQEYESESAFMAAMERVGSSSGGYDQNIAPYARKIEKYMYTH